MRGGYNNRGARGASNRSQRGSGQSSGRGASSSSSKSRNYAPFIPTRPRAMQNRTNLLQDGAKQFHNSSKTFKNNNSKRPTGIPSGPNAPNEQNPFESERNENAAKRAQRGQAGATISGKGNWQTKQAGAQDALSEQKASTLNRPQSFTSANPFAPLATATSQSTTSNPFGVPSKSNAPATSFQLNGFQPTSTTSSSGIFGGPTDMAVKGSSSQNTSIVFGAPSTASNPFGMKPISTFGSSNTSSQPSVQAKRNPFGATSSNGFGQKAAVLAANSNSRPFGNASQKTDATFGSSAPSIFLSRSSNGNSKSLSGGSRGAAITGAFGQTEAWRPAATPKPSRGSIAERIADQLRKDSIFPPSLSLLDAGGSTTQKNNAHTLWSKFQEYRAKARKSLMGANLLDDPEKPKKLKDAIAFKGTCEDMCPAFEVVTRIMDGRVDSREKDVLPDGSPSMHLNPARMVKALARSAAGQDAPLPSDVRSAAALRRTVDHLFNTILSENGLEVVHGFLWDRTRAVRRDFVFHSSMSPSELIDQVYCLEHITRFHVIALHQMSREGIHADGFVEQQEREQLSKSLLSLMHAYEDCKAQRVHCENEIEFKAYYVLFNGEQPDILEVVQNWGWKYWGESEEIRIAVRLAESIQNTWDVHGPLSPLSTTEISQNAYAQFFTIVEDAKVSYTMACFAEIYFTKVRKAILCTILSSYRKQRDQTKDWTPKRLNTYLRFDSEEEVEPFILLYGLRFEENENDGSKYLSFDLSEFQDPHPPPKQSHSYHFVERKRGDYSLTETINSTVYDEAIAAETMDEEEENELFVRDDSATGLPPPAPFVTNVEEDSQSHIVDGNIPFAQAEPIASGESSAKSSSLSEGLGSKKNFSNDLHSSSPSSTESANRELPQETAPVVQLVFPKAPSIQSTFSFPAPQQPEPSKETSTSPGTFSFLNPITTPSGISDATKSQSGSQSTTTVSLEAPKVSSSFSQVVVNPLPSFTFGPTISQAALPLPIDQLSQQPVSDITPGTASQPIIKSGEPIRPATSQPQGFLNTSSLGSNVNFQNTPTPSVLEVPRLNNRALRFDKLTEWVVNGEDGLIEHFTSFQVETILRQTFASFLWEKQTQAEQEADRLARQEADDFRYRSLATKYGHLWRWQAQLLWLKRQAREARKVRQEMAESRRASKAAESARIVDDFRASTTVRRKNSLESLLGATGALDGVHDSIAETRAIVHKDGRAHKRQRSEKSSSTQTSGTSRHKRGKSDNPLRRSLLSDPSYLSGGSRIHLLTNPGFQDDTKQPVSGVKTDYFRLKARGITTLPNGTPLANTAAMDFLHSKRSVDGIQKTSTTSQAKATSTPKTNPPPVPRFWSAGNRVDDETDIQALKLRAKEIMSADKKSRQKRSYIDDDDDLFERAKRLREQMDEGASWFRKEIERDTVSRSVS